MARVQLFEGGNIHPIGTTDARMRAPDFGPGAIATGVKAAGQALAQYAENENEIADIQDRASVKEATSTVGKHYAEIGFTGQNPYFESGGKDALTRRPEVEKGLDDLIAEARKGLANDRQREIFDEAIVPQRTQWGVQIAQHAGKEAKQYDTDETSSRITVTGELARATYLADPEHGEQQIATGLDEIDHLGKTKGWGPEAIAEAKLKFTSGTYKDVGTRISYEGAAGPKLAQAFIEKHGTSMTADDREAVLTHARTAQNALDAEVRRQEAEARRIAREAKQDAGDRAEAVARMLADGVHVEPEMLASAIGDAKAAENPALEETIRQGGMKNSLTQEWANATPRQLQDRVNELSAEITQKGGKVRPDLIVERDHLQMLAGKSRSQLNSDPIAWGAEHLGLKPTPLDLKNEASISDRINLVTTIAKRTGTPPRPLMQDEVAATQQIYQHGTVQDKVGLAMRLAKLGPLALSAAEQLTTNVGFHNLIGLATHGNRGVAMSRVNEVVTGYEVLKTKPKLIDKDQAQRQFNEMVGTSLQFLPGVREGVLSNAQAILATQANERGWDDWGQKDSRAWFRSVNSALGAFTRNGKQIGGLHTFNGAITVIPESMSEDEFEETISKSNAPQFKAAQNGQVAPTASGHMPTASDLKKMQWVPSGDGIYRLSDGSGFLKTTDGRFYEIDMSRLHPSTLDKQLAAHGYVRR